MKFCNFKNYERDGDLFFVSFLLGVPDLYRPSGYAALGPMDNRTDLPTIPHAEKALILPSIQFSCIQLQSLQNIFVTLHPQWGSVLITFLTRVMTCS